MTLRQIQRLIERGEYEMSEKVRTFIEEGLFDEDDLIECVLTAECIYKTERDERQESVDRQKYVLLGRDTRGRPFYTAGKVRTDNVGRFYFYITAHPAD